MNYQLSQDGKAWEDCTLDEFLEFDGKKRQFEVQAIGVPEFRLDALKTYLKLEQVLPNYCDLTRENGGLWRFRNRKCTSEDVIKLRNGLHILGSKLCSL